MALRLVLREQPAPAGARTPMLVDVLLPERPVDIIMLDLGNEGRDGDDRGVEDQVLQELERPEPAQPGQKEMKTLANLEMPVLAGDTVADYLDLTHVATAQAALVRQADVGDGQGIKAHQFGRDGVDRYLVGRSQDDVLDLGLNDARTGPVAGGSAVHEGKDAGVDLLLDGQQVDQRLVNPRMCIVAMMV